MSDIKEAYESGKAVGRCQGARDMEVAIAMDVVKEILLLKQSHYECEDSWYSCPLSREGTCNEFQERGVCNCGAEKHNAKVDAIVDELRRRNV